MVSTRWQRIQSSLQRSKRSIGIKHGQNVGYTIYCHICYTRIGEWDRGRVSACLKAVYTGMSSEVKVGEEHSKLFRVAETRMHPLTPAVLTIHQLTGQQAEGGRRWGDVQGPIDISAIVCRCCSDFCRG